MLIQKLRLQRGWSQQQLAELSGLSTRTIQRIERGDPPSLESLKSLAAVFEVDFATLQSSQPEPTMSTTLTPSLPADPLASPAAGPAAGAAAGATAGATDAVLSTPSRADEELAFRHVRKVRGFYMNLGRYLVVVSILLVINYTMTPGRIWAPWVAGGWGIGLLFHAMRVFEWLPFLGGDWERRQVEKRLGRPL